MIGPSRAEGTSTRQICDTNQLTQIWRCSSMSGLVHEQGHLEPYSYTHMNKELCYRTTRCQSKSYQPSCTTNWSNGIRWLRLTVVVKQPPLINCHIGVVDKLGRPRQWLPVLLITRLTCLGEIEIKTFRGKYPNFLRYPSFLYNTVWDRWKEAYMPRTSSIHPVLLT